jgi:bifunctional non-homologous end joining protein LigD
MANSSEPMKAKLSDRPFDDSGWVFERKLDGIRALVRCEGGGATLTSRTGKDLSSAYPELVEALAGQPGEFVADGEIVAFDGRRTSFERLQGRMGIHDPRLARLSGIPVFLYLFDLLRFDGHDLTGLPLRDRKSVLRRGLSFADPIRYSQHRNGRGEAFFEEACEKGWEGLIAKRADSVYVHGRSGDWLKLKCSFEQELVIGGFTPPKGSRGNFGALLVGYYEDGGLRFAGKVGTGFSVKALAKLGARLVSLEVPDPPFERGGLPRDARWVRPQLVGQFAFSEWTRDGKLRHPRYLGLREDKPAGEVVREMPGA